jgi:hypothetical protein
MAQDQSVAQNQNVDDDQSIAQDQSIPDDESTGYDQSSRQNTPPESTDLDSPVPETTTKDGVIIDDETSTQDCLFNPRSMSQMEILMYVGAQFEEKSA